MRYTMEQIVAKLRAAEIELAKGQKTPDVRRKLGISEQTYYRWRREYGGLQVEQIKRLRQLERENARLKKVIADQALDLATLKEATRDASEPAAAGAGRPARVREARCIRAPGLLKV